MTHRRDIEGLRALAVVAVIAYHAGLPGTSGGFIGVDSFFVISGFLITGLLLTEQEQSGRIDLARFYARRARRLLPISTLVLLTTAVAAGIVLPATDLSTLGADVLAAAGFGINLLLASRGTDYLAGDVDPSAIQHYWSLAVEEQFYVLWPTLIAVVSLKVKHIRRSLGRGVALVIAGSFVASVLLSGSSPTWSYFGLHTRAWELAIGAALALIAARTARIGGVNAAALGAIGLIGLLGSIVFINGSHSFPGWIAIVPVLSTAAVIAAGPEPTAATRLLNLEPLQWIGARSYSLYLWHWPVLVLAPHLTGRDLSVGDTLVAIGVVVALSEAGYRFVENPIRYSSSLASSARRSLMLGATCLAVAALAGGATVLRKPDLSTGVVAAAPDALPSTTVTTTSIHISPSTSQPPSTTSTVPPAPSRVDNRTAEPLPAVVDALSQTVLPDNLRPGIYEANLDTSPVYGNGCHQFLTATLSGPCVFGDPDADFTIGLIGDSHAAQWFTPLENIALGNDWRLISHTQGGCPVIDSLTWNRGAGAYLTQCEPWRAAVFDEFEREGVDIVLMSQHWGLLTGPDGESIPASEWQNGLPDVIERVRAIGAEPLLILDSPDPYDSVPSCVAANRSDLTVCEPGRLRQAEQAARTAAEDVVDRFEVGVIDPHQWICVKSEDDESGTARCPVVVGDILVYRDSHHLTETFANWMTPVLEAELVPWAATQANS